MTNNPTEKWAKEVKQAFNKKLRPECPNLMLSLTSNQKVQIRYYYMPTILPKMGGTSDKIKC